MGLADGLAALIGQKFKSQKIYHNKTLLGSITVMLTSLIISLIFNNLFKLNYNIITCFLISITATILELVGNKGKDNLYLPLGIFFVIYLLGGI
jgi:dolichol kinase